MSRKLKVGQRVAAFKHYEDQNDEEMLGEDLVLAQGVIIGLRDDPHAIWPRQRFVAIKFDDGSIGSYLNEEVFTDF